jgi:5-methylcytosine-specific restriction endonuclease McrA
VRLLVEQRKMCNRGHIYTPATRHGRCPVCAKDKQRYAEDPHRQALSSPGWQKTRRAVRKRDGNRCVYESDECNGQLEVHHLVSVRRGGALFDMTNLVTVCRAHHEVLEREQRRPGSPTSATAKTSDGADFLDDANYD